MRKQYNAPIELPKEEKLKAAAKIREYIKENFEAEIGNLQAGIFLDFITQHVGIYYYNKGIADSLALMTEKMDDLYLLMKDEEENP